MVHELLNSVAEAQEQTLASDIIATHETLDFLSATTGRALNPSRILALLSATANEDDYLRATVDELFAEAEAADRNADVLLGLNSGAECPVTLQELYRRNDTQVVHLDVRRDERDPGLIDNGSRQMGHRVFVVHQEPGKDTAGKIRMLRDLYTISRKSVERGWIPPSLTVLLDAESRFVSSQRGPFGLSSALLQMDVSSRLEVIGTKNRFCMYETTSDGRKLPNLEAPVHPFHNLLNLLHGKRGFRWMPGGGTLGDTLVILALGSTISRYPGARAEDVMGTVLAESIGVPWDVSEDVTSTNRCADGQGNAKQLLRWMQSIRAVYNKYGPEATCRVIDCDLITRLCLGEGSARKNILELIGEERGPLIEQAIRIGYPLIKEAAKHPDILEGEGAVASW